MENTTPNTVTVHRFASTGEAYDACMCYETIKRGDVLVIESEGVVGVAYTWPFAVTPEAGELHRLVDNAAGNATRAEFAESIKAAEAEAAKLAPASTAEQKEAEIARIQANRAARGMSDPMNRLCVHVNRAIEQGAPVVTEQPARPTVAAQVHKELEEMKRIGMRVSRAALAYPEAHVAEMDEFRDGGMKISEIADYVALVAK